MKTKLLDPFAKYFPLIIFTAIISGFLISIVIERVDLAIRGLLIALPAIISSIFLLLIRKKEPDIESSVTMPLFKSLNFRLLFVILYCSSFIILLLHTGRPWYYFLNMLLLYIVIFFQIFSRKINTNLILFELILCMLNSIYGITLKYPYYFAGGDVFGHLFRSEIIYRSGSLIPLDFDLYYHYFPLFHILISEWSYILGLSIKTTFFLVTAPIYAISIVFIYKLFIRTTYNQQISLLACMLYSVSSNVQYYGSYMITRVMAFVAFTIILYLIYTHKPKFEFKILVLILSIFLILVHHVSMPQIIILLSILIICEWIVSKKKYSHNNFFRLLNLMFIGYWFEVAYVSTKNILASHLNQEVIDTPVIKSTIIPGNEWIFILDNISVSIFVFFSLIGIGCVLWKKKYNYSYIICLFSLITLILYIPNPLQTMWQTMTMFRFDRFILLVSPFMAYSMAVGLHIFYKSLLKINYLKFFNILIVLLLLSTYITTSFSSVQVSNNLHSETTRKYFYYGELKGFNYVFNYVPNGSKLYSDYSVVEYFTQTEFTKSKNLGLPFYESNFVPSVESIPQYKGYFILRDKQFSEIGLDLGFPSVKYFYNNSKTNSFKLYDLLDKNDKVYSNSDVNVYRNLN